MKIEPNIPVVYKGKFPDDFVNDVNGWGSFSKQILQENFGKLLSLDIDYGTKAQCSLNCPHCFRRSNKADTICAGPHKILDHDKMIMIVKEARNLGLRSVKFLGAGEPFEAETTKDQIKRGFPDFRFLEFLRELKRLKITPSIFTKGHVIGDDDLVKKYYSRYGISTGEELVEELKDVNASILLGFNSFNTEIQDKMVGSLSPRAKVKDYTLKRNRALELLVKAGFNKHNPTHLCLAVNPITNDNIDEAFEIYKWARVRNLYPIVCPTMISGRCAGDAWRTINPPYEKLIDLYTKIYEFNIEKGIQTFEQVKEEGVSSYAGGHPCNQIACGMYITLTGTVLRCPGDDTTVFGNIWNESLEEIWLKSENYGRSGTFNCYCPPKWGKSIPYNLFTEVIIRLEKTQKQRNKRTV
ncbi:MAG: radical SAM protein [Candidatus Jordarchaeaceae archaeon]